MLLRTQYKASVTNHSVWKICPHVMALRFLSSGDMHITQSFIFKALFPEILNHPRTTFHFSFSNQLIIKATFSSKWLSEAWVMSQKVQSSSLQASSAKPSSLLAWIRYFLKFAWTAPTLLCATSRSYVILAESTSSGKETQRSCRGKPLRIEQEDLPNLLWKIGRLLQGPLILNLKRCAQW